MTEVWTEGGTRCFCGRPIPAAALDEAEARGRAEMAEKIEALASECERDGTPVGRSGSTPVVRRDVVPIARLRALVTDAVPPKAQA